MAFATTSFQNLMQGKLPTVETAKATAEAAGKAAAEAAARAAAASVKASVLNTTQGPLLQIDLSRSVSCIIRPLSLL